LPFLALFLPYHNPLDKITDGKGGEATATGEFYFNPLLLIVQGFYDKLFCASALFAHPTPFFYLLKLSFNKCGWSQ